MQRSYKTYNRYFVAILYLEDKNFKKYFNNIQEKYREVTYIIHDKDITEDGERKKEHMHILFKVGENARGINSIAEEVEIPVNYIEGCNKDNMLLYFIHYKKKNKYHYSINEVEGELKSHLMEIIENQKTEGEILQDINTKIFTDNIKDFKTLLQYCVNIKRVDILRKYSSILTNVLKEKKFIDKEKEDKIE